MTRLRFRHRLAVAALALAPASAFALAQAFAADRPRAPSSSSTSSPAIGIVFIVNAQNPVKSVPLRDVVDYYEKKRRLWPDGVPVRFVDRNPGSAERERFLREILKESESDVEFYWFREKLLTGDSSPIQLNADTLVIEMVKSFPGAIGYVSPNARVGNGVKPITLAPAADGG